MVRSLWNQVLTLINSGNEAEVARASLLGLPQVRILVFIGVDNGTIGQDDLKVGDLVTREAARVGMERVLEMVKLAMGLPS